MKYILILLGVTLVSLAFLPYNYGEMRTHKEVRYATMIDTSADRGSIRGMSYYNTYGIFRDKVTGKIFGDSINDSLYRQFEHNGNKPIEVSWPYDLDKMEQTSIGIFAILFSYIMWVAGAIHIIFGVASYLFKEEKE